MKGFTYNIPWPVLCLLDGAFIHPGNDCKVHRKDLGRAGLLFGDGSAILMIKKMTMNAVSNTSRNLFGNVLTGYRAGEDFEALCLEICHTRLLKDPRCCCDKAQSLVLFISDQSKDPLKETEGVLYRECTLATSSEAQTEVLQHVWERPNAFKIPRFTRTSHRLNSVPTNTYSYWPVVQES